MSSAGVSTVGSTVVQHGEGASKQEIKSMKKVLNDGGVFDMRGSIGKLWAAEIKDPKLRQRYEAIGKKHKAQQAFRAKWLSKTAKANERKDISYRAETEQDEKSAIGTLINQKGLIDWLNIV